MLYVFEIKVHSKQIHIIVYSERKNNKSVKTPAERGNREVISLRQHFPHFKTNPKIYKITDQLLFG